MPFWKLWNWRELLLSKWINTTKMSWLACPDLSLICSDTQSLFFCCCLRKPLLSSALLPSLPLYPPPFFLSILLSPTFCSLLFLPSSPFSQPLVFSLLFSFPLLSSLSPSSFPSLLFLSSHMLFPLPTPSLPFFFLSMYYWKNISCESVPEMNRLLNISSQQL